MKDEPMPDATPIKVKSPIESTPLSGGQAKQSFGTSVVEKQDISLFRKEFNDDLKDYEIQLQTDLRNILRSNNAKDITEKIFRTEVSKVLNEWIQKQWSSKSDVQIGTTTQTKERMFTLLFGNFSCDTGDHFIMRHVSPHHTILGSIEYKSQQGINRYGINALYQLLGYVVSVELPAWLRRGVMGDPMMVVLSPTKCYIAKFHIPDFMSVDNFTLTYAPFDFSDDDAVKYILTFLTNCEKNTEIHTELSKVRRDSLLGRNVPRGPRLVHPGLPDDGRVQVFHGVLLFCDKNQVMQIENDFNSQSIYEVGDVASTVTTFVVKVISNFYGLHSGKLTASQRRGDSLLKLLDKLRKAALSIPDEMFDEVHDLDPVNTTLIYRKELISYRRELKKILARTLCKVLVKQGQKVVKWFLVMPDVSDAEVITKEILKTNWEEYWNFIEVSVSSFF
eukprot:GHVR01052722.1.p1 GENE.GHVR01052722.1~~GHVR01052722.1.p1  ORF type:complete len:448 (+),score=20.19 GHVR01052722.1:45-1388(+)